MKSVKLAQVLVIFNLAILTAISLLFVPKSFWTPGPSSTQQVLGITTQDVVDTKYIPLKVCTKDFCQIISTDDIASLYTSGIVDEDKVYEYSVENIFPALEKFYGGQTLVSNTNGSFYTWSSDIRPDLSIIPTGISETLQQRDAGADIGTYNISLSSLPGTDGTYASKYIEIDNSSQTLYVWIDGKVVKQFGISGPVYGYQVYGVFPIADKGLDPVAPGGKYMPYWMAFYYSKSQASWYGLHALIWWYDSDGNKVYESTSNIRTRQSAGCIRVLLENAKYLYDNFNVGDPVLIHE
jgi:hypothetical protein